MRHHMFGKMAFVLLGLAMLHAARRHRHGPWRHYHHHGGDAPEQGGDTPHRGRVPPFFAEWHRRAHTSNIVDM